MEAKIKQALYLLYGTDAPEIDDLMEHVGWLEERAQQEFFLALHDKIEIDTQAFKKIELKMKLIENDIEDAKENLEAERMDFNI